MSKLWRANMFRKTLFLGSICFALACTAQAATIVTMDQVTTIEQTLADPNDLWVSKADLPRVNGFELKPEGACLDEICVPIRQSEDSSIFVTRKGSGWVNVMELARRVQQPVVADHETQTYSLGQIPVQRSSFVHQGLAPDFELTDWRGKSYRLSDFKGKKIMLLSWASW